MMAGSSSVDAFPVSDGRRVRWTLEQQRTGGGGLVRVDWLRATVPLDAVAPPDLLERVQVPDMSAFSHEQRMLVLQSRAAGVAIESAAEAARLGARKVADLLGGLEVGESEGRGMDYYTARCALVREGLTVGWVLAGGKSSAQAGTVHVNLFGSACLMVEREAWARMRAWLGDVGGWITRVDLAFDVFEGHDIEDVRQAYLAGRFDVRGKRPSQTEHGSWTSGHSRTFEVGKRDTGKLLRAYEKGDELFGYEAADPWIRYEVELRSNSRVIDLDVLVRGGDFFAGAYAFCATLLEAAAVVPVVIPTVRKLRDATASAAVTRVARWVRDTAAPSVAALLSLGGDWVDELIIGQRWRKPARFAGFDAAALRVAVEQVAAGMAPSDVRLSIGAA